MINNFRALHAVQRISLVLVYAAVVLVCGWALLTRTRTPPPTAAAAERDEPPLEALQVRFRDLRRAYRTARAPPALCAGVHTLVAVPSRPNGAGLDRRNALRASWLRGARSAGFLHRFFVGVPPATVADPRQRAAYAQLLRAEARLHDDLVLYDLEDSYADLFLKTHVLMQWQQRVCPRAAFLLKADDDTALDLERLARHMARVFAPVVRRVPLAVFGYPLDGRPIRDKKSKWYVSYDEYAETSFPHYTNGAIYLATTQAVAAILKHAPEVNVLHLEDVLYTGVLAERANVSRFGMDVFVNVYYWHRRCYAGEPHVAGVFGLSVDAIPTYTDWIRQLECATTDDTTLFANPRKPNHTYLGMPEAEADLAPSTLTPP